MQTVYTLGELQQQVATLFEHENLLHEPKGLYAPIDYTIALGGKRLRPTMLLAATQLFGAAPQQAYNQALAVELYHNFTLLHDDLMDQSPIRRGQPTVYRRWNPNTAILSGDTMLILAYKYLAINAGSHLTTILDTFNQLAIDVCHGQQYDMQFETQAQVSPDDYLSMIDLKTAALLRGSLLIGAQMADANADQQKLIADFGTSFGLSFQLQDDILDTYGDQASFGKKPGQDIRDNKKTLLLLTAFQQASPTQLSQLQTLIKQPESDEKVAAVRAIYDQIGVRQQVQQQADQYLEQARQTLDKIQTDDARKAPLADLLNSIARRNK